MKKLVMTLFFCFVLCFGGTVEAADQKTQPDGFGGIKWLEPLEKYRSIMVGADDSPTGIFVKEREDQKNFGGVKIKSIWYIFDHAGLSSIYMRFDSNAADVPKLVEACTKKWGAPELSNPKDPSMGEIVNTWDWEQVEAFVTRYSGDLWVNLKDREYRRLMHAANLNESSLIGPWRSGDGKSEYYMDANSVEERDGYIVAGSKFIPMVKNGFGRKKGQEIAYIVCSIAYNKNQQQWQYLKELHYNSSGQVLESWNSSFSPQRYQEIAPGTMAADFYMHVMRMHKMLK